MSTCKTASAPRRPEEIEKPKIQNNVLNNLPQEMDQWFF